MAVATKNTLKLYTLCAGILVLKFGQNIFIRMEVFLRRMATSLVTNDNTKNGYVACFAQTFLKVTVRLLGEIGCLPSLLDVMLSPKI